jgi:hypothetical protein
MPESFWAQDSWGLKDDQLAHFALSAWVSHLAGWPAGILAGVLIEIIELIRYRRWVARGRPEPWPFLCDRPSYKDLTYDFVGVLLGRLVP